MRPSRMRGSVVKSAGICGMASSTVSCVTSGIVGWMSSVVVSSSSVIREAGVAGV